MNARAESDADHPRSRWSIWAVAVHHGDFERVCGELLILGKSVIRHTHGAATEPSQIERVRPDREEQQGSRRARKSLNNSAEGSHGRSYFPFLAGTLT